MNFQQAFCIFWLKSSYIKSYIELSICKQVIQFQNWGLKNPILSCNSIKLSPVLISSPKMTPFVFMFQSRYNFVCAHLPIIYIYNSWASTFPFHTWLLSWSVNPHEIISIIVLTHEVIILFKPDDIWVLQRKTFWIRLLYCFRLSVGVSSKQTWWRNCLN